MSLALKSDRFDPSVATERQSVAQALSEGLSYRSPMPQRYEEGVARTFAARHVIGASSGFGALVIALSALGLRPGDKVILTPTCPLCTVYALTFMRLIPVFCDIRPDDFSMDIAHVDRLMDGQTKALLEIPMWGYPVPADEVAAYAQSKGLPFVLDIALAHMAKLNGRLLWSYADIATFSTHASKSFVTGEGGAVLTNDSALAAQARSFVYPDDGSVLQPSLNYSIAGLQAALGLARLERLEADIATRVNTMERISSALDNAYVEPLPLCAGGVASGTKLIIRDKSGCNKALVQHLNGFGIPSDIATYNCRPLYQYAVMKDFAADCKNAEHMLSSITTIPVHPDVGSEEIGTIISALNSYQPGRI